VSATPTALSVMDEAQRIACDEPKPAKIVRAPMDVVVVVEIPKGSHHKYEIDRVTGTLWLDRVLSTATEYPTDYGYIVDTLAEDGDAIDAMVILEQPTVPGCRVRARPIGVLLMADEQGPDPKILCVATGDPMLGHASELRAVPPHLLDEIEHFFRVYKQLEPGKETSTMGWQDARAAEQLIEQGREHARR